jgi:nucleotide-binding universal stress UspA family protein
MHYKTILAFLPTLERAERVLDVALPIAEAHDAHLTGIHTIPEVTAFYGMVEGQMPADIIEQQRRMFEDDADKIRTLFEKRTTTNAARSEWRSARDTQGDEIQKFINMSMCADLIVTDQAAAGVTGYGSDVAARMVLGTARPVLIVPSVGNYSIVGKRPLIAWNGEKEAARAAFDAIPLMMNAELVQILAIDPNTSSQEYMIAQGDELAVCLARHGLKMETTTSITAGISVGDEILNRIADGAHDLLVMGCYGHSRLRELVFGGASRDVLQHMTAPVLMSH